MLDADTRDAMTGKTCSRDHAAPFISERSF